MKNSFVLIIIGGCKEKSESYFLRVVFISSFVRFVDMLALTNGVDRLPRHRFLGE
ncbi:MAG: hypothetical protein C5S47_08280 [Candidatus Methanogasteraceae archaeon]|nr:MAG: hypothetical protein C5S47_08280 [ANME-2 cluster archaeon]